MIIAMLIIFILSISITYLARKFALRNKILDLPNERSSHMLPTPRGGGIAIVISFSIVCIFLFHFNRLPIELYYTLTVGGLIIAAVGLIDDVYTLNNKVRLVTQFFVAGWALYWLHGFPLLDLGTWKLAIGQFGSVIATFAIVWLINLYNFMDGIDSLAGIEGLFTAVASAFAFWILGYDNYSNLMLLFAAAVAGFTIFNWPPAKIFMGDVGSSYLGYVLAVIGISTAKQNVMPITFWIILLGVFICDATFTLIHRAWQGKRIYIAHREHAYQHLNICGLSHKHISLAVLFINMFILLPLAFEVLNEPKKSIWFVSAMIISFLATWIYIKRIPVNEIYAEV